ncbi:MAG: septum formation initiator, partial [Prevotella sp.]|nr:septum formation initiator [Prevotella sp.]
KIAELEQEIELYKGQYESDLKKIRQMDNDPKIVEKIARERYFMKKADEDIFVLDTDVEAE